MFRIAILLMLSFNACGQSVYKTTYGAKYHLASCRMVENVSQRISLQEAGQLGLMPCKICKPTFQTVGIAPIKIVEGESNTVQCNGYTKAGSRCRHKTGIGNGYCYQHQP